MWSYLCCVIFTIHKDKSKDTKSSRKSPPFGGSKFKKGLWWDTKFSAVQFSSVAQSCPTLCDPMDCSTPGLPVHHQLLGFTQTHVHWVGDAIQPSHPLSSPSSSYLQSLPASASLQMSQFFAWGGQSIGVSVSTSVLPMNTQDWSPSEWTGWIYYCMSSI